MKSVVQILYCHCSTMTCLYECEQQRQEAEAVRVVK